MKRFILSPEAEQDLNEIKRYLANEAGITVARYVLRELKEGILFITRVPEAGHLREDLTDEPVKFWSVFRILLSTIPQNGRSKSRACYTATVMLRLF